MLYTIILNTLRIKMLPSHDQKKYISTVQILFKYLVQKKKTLVQMLLARGTTMKFFFKKKKIRISTK